MSDEDWVTVAMADDLLVAKLLLRLNQVPQPQVAKMLTPAIHVEWIVRQRRSKEVPRLVDAKKKTELTRASPTTPLSWSGPTSVSGGAGAVDGSEESSRLVKTSDCFRSEIIVQNETAATPTLKRPRRKKTLAELKEEESLLLKERRDINNTLETLRLSVEKHRATHECLKRMKLGLQSQQRLKTATTSTASEETISDQPRPQNTETVYESRPNTSAVVHCNDVDAVHHLRPSNVSCRLRDIESSSTSFLLPDLNLPFQEDFGISGMS